MKPSKLKKNPHSHVRWMVFTIIVALIWFKYPPPARAGFEQLGAHLLTLLISASLIYAVLGRIAVWVIVGLMALGHAFGASFREAEDNRRQMREFAGRIKAESPLFLESERRPRAPTVLEEAQQVAPDAVPAFGAERVLN